MIGFFIKKAFFDGWDNLIGMVIHNLGFLLVMLALMGGLSLGEVNMALSMLVMCSLWACLPSSLWKRLLHVLL